MVLFSSKDYLVLFEQFLCISLLVSKYIMLQLIAVFYTSTNMPAFIAAVLGKDKET